MNFPCQPSPQPSTALYRLVFGPSHPLLSSLLQWDEFSVSCEFLGEELQRGFMTLNSSPACLRPWLLTSDRSSLELPGCGPIAYAPLLKPSWEAIGLLDMGEGQL